MAQVFLDLDQDQAAGLAARFDIRIDDRPMSDTGWITGEMYSIPDAVFLRFGNDGLVDRVAVEGIWPNG